MSDASWPLQQAVYSALTGASAVTALLASASAVYNHVPQDSAFPYITFGVDTAADWGTKTEQGQAHTLDVHVWSRYRGTKEARQVLAAVYGVLHEQPGALSVSGHTVVEVRYRFSRVVRDPDGLTYHGVAQYQVLTEAT